MRRKKILRWTASVAIGLVGIATFGSQLASASGGGGCGRLVTDARGAEIRIHAFCFTPTILRIRPGQTVTWVNRDPFSHTVMGANAAWGTFGELAARRSVTYRFVRAGVYPYVCTIHPGMVGAILVGSGDGLGDARATTTEAGPVTLVTPSPAADVVAAANGPITAVTRGATGYATWALLAVVAIMAALALVLALVGRRRPSAS